MSELITVLAERLDKLTADMKKEETMTDVEKLAVYHRKTIEVSMHALREVVDELETLLPSDIWPYPTYGEILYSVR